MREIDRPFTLSALGILFCVTTVWAGMAFDAGKLGLCFSLFVISIVTAAIAALIGGLV